MARLRAERLARSRKPFLARGGRVERCPGCRVPLTHCLCAWRPRVETRAGMCLLMHDIEPLRPSNTGWLIADVVPDTQAFTWARTSVDPQLLALLADPQWQPCVVFPGDSARSGRVTHAVPSGAAVPGRRPLFVLLDATWPEARKMFHRSPYLDAFPVLALEHAQLSRYRLRRARREGHLCTAEVAALCLALAGDERAAAALDAWLDLFITHSLDARNHRPAATDGPQHARLQALLREAGGPRRGG